MKNYYFKNILLSASIAVASFANASAVVAADNVGFVYVSPAGEAGYSHQHDLGRQQMEKDLAGKVTTKFVENVAEGADAERVIREMAKRGDKVVFATSFGFMNPMLKVSKQFPNTAFLHATGYKMGKNMGLYNARFYEGRYVAGVIAGNMTKSNKLGYVAAFPIPEVLQGINAFITGARSVNPKAELSVIWSNSWFDPGKERQAATTMIAQGADVLTFHTDSTSVVQTAEDKGVYSIGYHSDMAKFGPNTQLTSVTHHWGGYYTDTVKSVLAGTWKPASIWGGYQENMISLSAINDKVPNDVKKAVKDIEAKLRAGTFHPFTGPIVDQSGKTVVAEGKVMTDKELSSMGYYVQGVTSKFPKK